MRMNAAFQLNSSSAHHLQLDRHLSFVLPHCRVDTSKRVQPRPAGSGKRRRSRGSHSQPAEGAASEEEQYHPVLCAVCDQVTAVLAPVQSSVHAGMPALASTKCKQEV